MSGDLCIEAFGPSTVHVGTACIGRDGETWRHRKTEHGRHLSEVRTLATEEVLVGHGRLAVGVVECVDVRHVRRVYGPFGEPTTNDALAAQPSIGASRPMEVPRFTRAIEKPPALLVIVPTI